MKIKLTVIKVLEPVMKASHESLITTAKNEIERIDEQENIQTKRQIWKGKFTRQIEGIADVMTYLQRGHLGREVESVLIAVQKNVIRTICIKFNLQENNKCRL